MTAEGIADVRVGRERLRDELRQWVRGGAEGTGAFLVVEGEAGAGRTDFVRDALTRAAALGCRVRYAAADAPGVELPLGRARVWQLYMAACALGFE
ncbi:BREX system ATP-binding domain-containing protein, partial [Streptomyces sp. NPDC041003]|uniref:BREX system ATP-binding domain-containing protein n=1 Tax=Streptomyces sp. NPDC041003 TaxID=3155730 RepID=UPI0033FD94A5